jgi:hypothetical protein
VAWRGSFPIDRMVRSRVSPVETMVPSHGEVGASVWQTTGMFSPVPLVARLHIDLQRVQSAVCCAR